MNPTILGLQGQGFLIRFLHDPVGVSELRVPYFEVLIIRILPFRVLY